MTNYGNTSGFLSIVGLFSLVIYLSLFSGLAGFLINKVIDLKYNVFLFIPSIWVVKDFIVEKLFGGFPWEFIGYSQINNYYFSQVAEIGGIYLLSFLVILIGVYLSMIIFTRNKKLIYHLIIVLVIIYLTGFVFEKNSKRIYSSKESHRAGIIQPNWYYNSNSEYIPIREKLKRLFDMSSELKNKGAEFVIWPEYTVSLYPNRNKYYLNKFKEFTKRELPIFAGYIRLETRNEFYNTIFLFIGDNVQTYDKTRLTPFGEYVPFRKLLFFVKKITRGIHDFSAGKEIKNLKLNGYKISTPICYEIIYPEIVRDFIKSGGNLIITISNDSWFGKTSAPYQHLSMARMRAIETRRYILRSTSTGISALIDPFGKLLYTSPLYKPDKFVADFKFSDYKTFYVNFGYLFPYFLSFLLLFFLIKYYMGKFRGKNET